MIERAERAVAVVGVGAMLPEAATAEAFWGNVRSRRYSIAEVPADRWSAADYYDPDPAAPDKTYTTLGAWVRLHYVYPYPHVDEVIALMRDGAVLPYLDIPFQHASPAVLRRMRRPAAQEKTLSRIARWREQCPELTLRSTFIVGFPGETDEDFELLLQWLDEAALDRVGCFRYEPVAGAAANDLAEAVADEVKEQRLHRFMQRHQAI